MTLSNKEQEAMGEFAQAFEAACIGLQMNNPEVPTLSPQQYALSLAAAVYAAQKMLTAGNILPSEDSQANFSGFYSASAVHYAETVVKVATAKAEEVLGQFRQEQEELTDEPS